MIVQLLRRVQMQGSCNDGAAMSDEDWRVEVELADAEGAARLHVAGKEGELIAHARQTLAERAVLSVDGPLIFAYANTRESAEAAKTALSELLSQEGLEAKTIALSRWHDVAEEWEDADAPLPAGSQAIAAEHEDLVAAELADPDQHEWEVRATLPSHTEAVELAERFAQEGVPTQRHWHYILLGARNEPEAEKLAERVRNEAPAGTKVRTELTFAYVLKNEPNTPLRYLSPFVAL
jgi:hypothetical protein